MSERIKFNPEEEQPEEERFLRMDVFRRFMSKTLGSRDGDSLYYDPQRGTLVDYRNGENVDLSVPLGEILPKDEEKK